MQQYDMVEKYLREAYKKARTFDAAPDFTFSRIRFYSSDQKFFAADDFGQTAVQGIINQLSDSKNSDKFLELLERIQHENQ